jgi:membrane protease YdiL (CAAX protease family)
MGKLRAWFEGHPLLGFVLVAYGFSWGLWALMIAAWGQINWLGSFGPAVGAVVVVAIRRGREGLRSLLRPMLSGRFGIGWYAFIIPGVVLLMLLGLRIYTLLGSVVNLPRDAVLGQLVLVPLYFLIVLIIGGPLGEEIGWRGYLLPYLLKQKSPLYASLIVFVLWFAWHLPLFWLPGASQRGTSLPWFMLFLAGWSVLFTWVYLGTAGSLLSALLLHTTINTYSLTLQGVDPVYVDAAMPAYAAVFAVLAAIVIAVDRRMRPKAAVGAA